MIDIQKNATSAECDYTPVTPEEFMNSKGTRIERLMKTHHPSVSYPDIDINAVEKLAEMLDKCERPLLICGGGVVRSKASEEFRELAHRLDIPTAITVMGGGAFGGYDRNRNDRNARLSGFKYGL